MSRSLQCFRKISPADVWRIGERWKPGKNYLSVGAGVFKLWFTKTLGFMEFLQRL